MIVTVEVIMIIMTVIVDEVMTATTPPQNFMDHIRSKKHRRMIVYYGEKIAATEKLLKAQSWVSATFPALLKDLCLSLGHFL